MLTAGRGQRCSLAALQTQTLPGLAGCPRLCRPHLLRGSRAAEMEHTESSGSFQGGHCSSRGQTAPKIPPHPVEASPHSQQSVMDDLEEMEKGGEGLCWAPGWG